MSFVAQLVLLSTEKAEKLLDAQSENVVYTSRISSNNFDDLLTFHSAPSW